MIHSCIMFVAYLATYLHVFELILNFLIEFLLIKFGINTFGFLATSLFSKENI